MRSLKNGTIWKDTDGNEIHAHGGYIIFHDGYYYWYGEDRRENYYVSCYRSKNLMDWEFRNNVLTTESAVQEHRVRTDTNLKNVDENGNMIKVNIERPKVLYNKLINKFVMWMHFEDGINYEQARCAIAVCDTPDGDFVYYGSFRHYGNISRDCTLFCEDDGTAYFVAASRDNADLNIYRLTADYLNVDSLVNVIYQGEYREAPAIFKKDGLYWLISSGCTGWRPNQGKVGYSKSMNGSWSLLENFGDKTTFDSQSAFVLSVEKEGKTTYLYFGDRWGVGDGLYFTSSYVVLPIQFMENGTPFIEYKDEFFI